jgi:hypothetical protein
VASVLTQPAYQKPDDERIRAAMQRVVLVAECIPRDAYVVASALVRFVIGPENAVTVAQAMWAIYELTQVGGLSAWPRNFCAEWDVLLTEESPPAGLAISPGTIQFGSGPFAWNELLFRIDHQKLGAILATKSESVATPSTNNQKFSRRDVPSNRRLIELAARLKARYGSGKSKNQIAREFTGEPPGNDRKAQSLLSQIRRLIRQGRLK